MSLLCQTTALLAVFLVFLPLRNLHASTPSTVSPDTRIPGVGLFQMRWAVAHTRSHTSTPSRQRMVAERLPHIVTIHIDRHAAPMISQFETGVTHAQYSLDPWGDPTSINRAKDLLKAACRYQNQHIMGWGADNPEPSPGVFHWDSLD